MISLYTIYVGLELKSPIIVGSAGITETVERMRKAQDNGAGAVIMKSLFEEEVSRVSPTPRFRIIHHPMGDKNTFSLYSYEQASEWGPERYAEEISRAKKELEIPIIASINCITEKGWTSYARMVEEANADALEINLSCPHGSIMFRGGDVEQNLLNTAKLVRKSVSLPVIAKLGPQLTSPLQMVKKIKTLGINGVTLFNRLTGIEIDINEEKPVMHQGYAGHGGPWSIQYPLRWISEISPQVKIDISGSGGVSTSEDVIKYLLAGATTVQTVTAVILNGYEIIKEINRGLKEYMSKKGYDRIEDFRGRVCSRIRGTYEIERTHYLKASINDKLVAPCQAACPAGVDVQGYVALASRGRFEEAFQLIREKVPFPSVLSRVCPAPCEGECTRRRIDESLAINHLKRFLSDWNRRNSCSKLSTKNSKPITGISTSKVAIIGSGPAGLTCAHDLVRMGYEVVVFESQPLAGGMLSFGIPQYRLPREIVQNEISEIVNMGVELRLNATIGRDLTLNGLKERGYGAVFLATGAHKDRKLGIPGENLKGVIPGLSFLKDLSFGKQTKVGRKVAVIGGGNAAVDAARCSLRLGAEEAYVVYRRTREEMPAIPEKVKQAEEEGVKMVYLQSPLEIVETDGRVSGLRCVPLVLGEKDEGGRRGPLLIAASCFSLKVDAVIVSISQVPDLSLLKETDGFQISENGTLAVHPTTFAAGVEGIFAAGDLVTGPATVIEAIAAGKRVAISIDRYLKGEPLQKGEVEGEMAIPFEQILREKGFVGPEEKKKPSFVPPEIRKATFEEVERALGEQEAVEEARRCLSCGCGLGCGICEKICIHSAIDRVGSKYQVNSDSCDGCGLCVEVCPKENIKMVRIQQGGGIER